MRKSKEHRHCNMRMGKKLNKPCLIVVYNCFMWYIHTTHPVLTYFLVPLHLTAIVKRRSKSDMVENVIESWMTKVHFCGMTYGRAYLLVVPLLFYLVLSVNTNKLLWIKQKCDCFKANCRLLSIVWWK